MRVLVTGASGFVGRHCVDVLRRRGFDVHCLTRGKQIDGCQTYKLDLLQRRESISECLRVVRPTHLLHLAWSTEHGKYWSDPANLDWVQSSLELYRQFHIHGGHRAVFAGTCAEYDWTVTKGPAEKCVEEITPLNPHTLYGESKKSLCESLLTLSRSSSASVAWGRVFFPFGPDEGQSRLIPYVVRSLLANRDAECSHGKQIRDLMYVTDLAEAFVVLLESSASGVFNLSSGQGIQLKAALKMIARNLGCEDKLKLGAIPAASGDAEVLIGDNSKLLSLGWTEHVGLEEGIARTIDYWRSLL